MSPNHHPGPWGAYWPKGAGFLGQADLRGPPQYIPIKASPHLASRWSRPDGVQTDSFGIPETRHEARRLASGARARCWGLFPE